MNPSTNLRIMGVTRCFWIVCWLSIFHGTLESASVRVTRTSETQLELKIRLPFVAPFLRSSFPINYTLQESNDLKHWNTLGNPQALDSDNMFEETRRLSKDSPQSFFRIQRTVIKDKLRLSRGDLTLALLSGLDLSGQVLSFTTAHGADFTGTDLRGSDLFRMFGERAQFTRADLTGSDLSGAVVEKSRFDQAKLVGAASKFARLAGTSFRDADLRFADFTGADLFSTDLSNADLRGAVLLETDLRLVRFHGSRIDALTRIPPDFLLAWQIVNEGRPGATLDRLDLSGMILTESNLRNASLQRANLTAVDFTGADLRGADLRHTTVPLVTLKDTQIDEATLFPEPLRLTWEIVNQEEDNRQLNRANLVDTVLSGGYLKGASLVGAKLQGALLFETNLQHADLREANLRNTQIQGADLRFANLRGARLPSPDQLTQAKFEQTIMPDGTIRNDE